MILVHLVHVTTAGTVRLHDVNHLMDVNHPMDVNNLSRLLALTVGLVNHLCLDIDPTHVKPASHLLRTTVVRHLTTTTAVVGLSDVLIPSATGRIVVLTTTHDRITHDSTTHALRTNVLVHQLLSIVDPIPALRPVAVLLDATFVELLIAILAIIVHNLVTVVRTSILLLLQLRLIRFVKVHQDLLLLHHVVIRKTPVFPLGQVPTGTPPRAALKVQPLGEDGDDDDNTSYVSHYYSVLHLTSSCRSPKTKIVVEGAPHTSY